MPELMLAEHKIGLIDLVRRAGFAQSNSEARRLIAGGGIRLDGEAALDVNLAIRRDAVLSRGKSRFIRIRFERD